MTAGKSENPKMDPEIWQDFPEDLLEPVIARLPIASFFRFRSISKNFNSMLTSQSFSQQCAQLESTLTQPWFYTMTDEYIPTGVMYDPIHKKWHHRTIPALPAKSLLLPVASAGGLVCLLDISHRTFYVCNPITRSCKELSAAGSANVRSRAAVGMTLDKESSSHKVVWVRSGGEYEVYDSKDGSYTGTQTGPGPFGSNFRFKTVSVDQTIYFMRTEPHGLVSYDTISGLWSQLPIPGSGYHSLAECNGRVLLLVGLLSIWELDKMTLLWKEVDRMPNELCLESSGEQVTMTCLGNKGLIVLSLMSRQRNQLVTYNLGTREWDKVPACVLPWGRKEQWINCGEVFQPCLTAVA